MALAFSRSLRSLGSERLRVAAVTAVGAALLLVAWGAWFGFGRVALVAASTTARTVVDRAAYPVTTPVAGRVAAVAVVLGQAVHRGDELVRLDATDERAALSRAQARRDALQREVAAIDEQLAATSAAGAKAEERDVAAVAEEAARRSELALVESHARAERNRLEPLRGQGILSEARIAEAQAAVEMAVQVLATFDQTRVRQQSERELASAERAAAAAELRQRRARLASEQDQLAADLEQFAAALARRTIRAPADGTLSALGPRVEGAWLDAGAEVATVVAEGSLTVVAHFPAAAIGRVATGAPGRLRLDAFPSARYGSLPAHVARIGREIVDGAVAVELDLDAAASAPMPLQHGLVGNVEIDTEDVTPWQLLMHHIGWSREARR